MKRRGFIRALATTPAVPALLAQQAPPAGSPATVPGGRGAARGGPGRGGGGGEEVPKNPHTEGKGGGGGGQDVPKIPLADENEAAEGVHKFFTAPQFATLRKLGGVLVPPVKGNV